MPPASAPAPRRPVPPLFALRRPGESDPLRLRVRRWLTEHPAPAGPELLDAGYLVPHWPAPWGWAASGADLQVISDELARAGVALPGFPLSRGYIGPLILTTGTQAQRDRYLRRLLTGEEIWCQLFSEPEAGSDLAALRTRARRDGDGYLVDGTKIWTTHGHLAQFGLLLARTDPAASQHQGISCFICPMDAPGLTLQPIYDMAGEHKWNLTHFDQVRLGAGHLIGAENDGWRIARGVLANERMSMSADTGLAWGNGPCYLDLLDAARLRTSGAGLSPGLRGRVARGYSRELALHVLRTQALGQVSPEARGGVIPEVRRTLSDQHGQQMLELWRDLHGPAGVAARPGRAADAFASYYFFARALTLGGGSAEIQRNVLAERILGLPREAAWAARPARPRTEGGR
jgi:alkylation response protein AidB-like acyl-CoA dehydrogenase